MEKGNNILGQSSAGFPPAAERRKIVATAARSASAIARGASKAVGMIVRKR